MGRSTWFKDKKRKREDVIAEEQSGPGLGSRHKGTEETKLKTRAVLFVEQTPQGELAKQVREAVKEAGGPRGCSVKVVEQPGQKIHLGLSRNNPFKRKHCDRPLCPLAASGDDCKEACYKEGVVYQASCNICTSEDKTNSVYIGETSRTLYTRIGQHVKDYKAAKEQLKAS